MQLLLDTHTLLWFFTGNANLSDRVRNWISDIGIRFLGLTRGV